LAEEGTEMYQIAGDQAIGAGKHGRHEDGTILPRQGDWTGHAWIRFRNRGMMRWGGDVDRQREAQAVAGLGLLVGGGEGDEFLGYLL